VRQAWHQHPASPVTCESIIESLWIVGPAWRAAVNNFGGMSYPAGTDRTARRGAAAIAAGLSRLPALVGSKPWTALFDEAGERAAAAAAPLAVRMRPRSLDEVIGQRHNAR